MITVLNKNLVAYNNNGIIRGHLGAIELSKVNIAVRLEKPAATELS